MSTATETTTSTTISKPKNRPASLVDTAMPRIITQDREGGEDRREDSPRDVPVQVVVEGNGQEAARDGDYRGHRDDVADPGDQGGGYRACTAERLADEGDEAAGGRMGAGELRQRVPEQGDGHGSGHDGQRRSQAGRRGDQPEAEEEAHRRADVGHRCCRDVQNAECAPAEAVLASHDADRRALAVARQRQPGRDLQRPASWPAASRRASTYRMRSWPPV